MSDSPSQAGGGEEDPGTGKAIPALGQTLGRYTLLAVLGRGAMATVFRARDNRLGREVAVKVMGLAIAVRSDAAERFRREALAVAGIKHPNIVEVFDFVPATATEPAYIVSELIEGITLGEFLAKHRGRVLPETAALLALPIAEALAAAHAHGVVHRDLKPDNVMVEVTETAARIVLTDFGVAHVTGLETMTVTGALVGSPSYMSPEQALGKDIGAPSDLWGLGVLLYQVGTGHLPFSGSHAWAVVGAITQGAYKRPSGFEALAGSRFDEICGRCLERDPTRRFPDARALAEALRGYLEETGIDPGAVTLRRVLTELEAFEAELRPRVANAAVAAAREHRRRGDLARALTELARATAYVPNHPEAMRLCQGITARRRLSRVGLGAFLGAALLGGGAVAFSFFAGKLEPSGPSPVADRTPPAEAVAPGPGPTAKEEAIALPEASSGQPLVRSTPRLGARDEDRGSRKRPRVRVAARSTEEPPSSRDETAAEAAPPANPPATGEPRISGESAAEPGPAAALEPAAEPEPAATRAEPAAPAKVTVKILASHLFCRPSLNDGKADESPVTVRNVPVGRHRVYCTMGQGGSKVFAGHVEVVETPRGGVYVVRLDKGERNKPVILESGLARD